MSDADLAIQYVINFEGGLVDNPSDPGGLTNFGISTRFLYSLSLDKLHNYGYLPHGVFKDEIIEYVKNLTREKAIAIYKSEFWTLAPFNEFKRQSVCNYLFDCTVNMGLGQAIHIAQRAVNAYHGNQQCTDDGVLGPQTLNDINSIGFALMPSLRSERAAVYRLIATNNSGDQKIFLAGWLKRAYCG